MEHKITTTYLYRSTRKIVMLAIASSILAGTAKSQRSLPFGDDALVLGVGQVRTGMHGSWQFYDQVYTGNGAVASYGSQYSFAAAGTAAFPSLAGNETAIRTVSGQNAFTLSLGATDVQATHRTASTSLLLDLGLPGRLMISAEIPFVRVEATARISANSEIGSANVGANPALTSVSAFAADTLLANQISRARTALSTQLSSCLGNSASQCATVNARRTEAQALVNTSATLSSGILLLATSPFVPLSSSATHAAITTRVAAVAAAYRDFGISTVTGTSITSATLPITGAAYRDFLANSSIGPGGTLPSFRTLTRLGDISLTAKFRVTETDKVRAAGFARIFFPTGGKPSAGELLPLVAGEGLSRTELGGVADLFLANRVFTTVTGSGIFGMSDGSKAGFNFSVTPGYAFNKWLLLGAQYQTRHVGDATDNRVGGGISFSNLSASRTMGPRFPLEATFFHSQSISGSGFQPKTFSDEIRVRIFARR
ncbi:MAG: hypothetical protein H0W69_05970 [Gemmatimonadaceae bacterium]|nr:hypothetical protein [Gemmatimonadaceae bacterium]